MMLFTDEGTNYNSIYIRADQNINQEKGIQLNQNNKFLENGTACN